MPRGDKHCTLIFSGLCNALKTFKQSIPSTFKAEIFYFFLEVDIGLTINIPALKRPLKILNLLLV